MTPWPFDVPDGSGDGVAVVFLPEQAQSVRSIVIINSESSFFISSLRGGFVL
jgi:hypothetical protein